MTNFASTILAAGAIALTAGAASAATVLNVTAPVEEFGVADGGVYGTVLTGGDVLSADVLTKRDGDTDVALGIQFAPSPIKANLSIAINNLESKGYGKFRAYLSKDAVLDDSDIGGELTLVKRGTKEFQFGDVTAIFEDSPFYVLLDWKKDKKGDFSFDVEIQPVPVPAAGFMLLAGLGGLAVARRRKA